MVPLSVLTEELPVISAQLGIEQSALSSVLAVAQPLATPVAPGPHFPGLLLAAAFGVMTPVICTNINAGTAEQNLYSDTLVPVSISYETNDAAGGATVSSAGAAVGK